MGWTRRWLWRSLRVRFLVPLLTVAAAGEFWFSVRPKPCPLDSRRVQLADEVASKLAESLPEPQAGRPSIMVLPFERDPTGSVTEAVRRAIERVDRYVVEPPSLWENACRRVGFALNPVSVDRAVEMAMDPIPAEYVLAGRVDTLSARSDMDEATLEGVLVPAGAASLGTTASGPPTNANELTVADERLAAPNRVVRLRAEAIDDHGAEAEKKATSVFSQPGRWLVWLLTASLIPLFSASVITRGLARESNGLNLAMLLGLTAIGGVAAWALLGLQPETGAGATALALTVAIGLAYNWCVLTKLEELRN